MSLYEQTIVISIIFYTCLLTVSSWCADDRHLNKSLLKYRRFTLWLILEFTGLRSMWEKIRPPNAQITSCQNYRRPSTFLLWFLAIYFTSYGIAAQRFQNSLDRLEIAANSLITLSSTTSWRSALERIPALQNKKCPIEPKIFNPVSIFKSYFFKGEVNQHIAQLLKWPILDKKKVLVNLNLDKIILSNMDLKNANFSGSSLADANFNGSNLTGADFSKCWLQFSSFENSDLAGASFDNAYIIGTTFKEASCQFAKFSSLRTGNYFNPFVPPSMSNDIPNAKDKVDREILFFNVSMILEITEQDRMWAIAKELAKAKELNEYSFISKNDKEILKRIRTINPNVFIEQSKETFETRLLSNIESLTLKEKNNRIIQKKEDTIEITLVKQAIINFCGTIKSPSVFAYKPEDDIIPSGYLVSKPVKKFFAPLSLEKNDIITKINGVKLDQFIDPVEEFEKFTKKKFNTLYIIRKNKLYSLKYETFE